MKNSYIVILVTAKDKAQAEKITQTLLDNHLIACGNIINSVSSSFYWLGKIDHAEECLIVMKSRIDLFEEVVEHVRGMHSYEVPEVLALPIVEGSKAYFDWMNMVLKTPK